MRHALAVALFLLAAYARAAQEAARPITVSPDELKAKADALSEAVIKNKRGNEGLRADAAALFTDVQAQTPLVRPQWRPPEREPVSGQVGTIDGMLATAQERLDQYRRTHREPPPPELLAAMKTAQALRESGRVDFDRAGALSENQMGAFRYVLGRAGGQIEVNQVMALIAARVGEAFAYATLAHEGGHADDHARGALAPAHVIEAEVRAFRAQYAWLTVMDPTGWRLAVLDMTLRNYLKLHPDSPVTAMAVRYLDHLNELWFTGGDEKELRRLVKRLGYADDPSHAAAPSSPRA